MMKARDAEVINAYIGGASIAALAQRFGLSSSGVSLLLKRYAPIVDERLLKLASRIIEFKLDAVEGAERGLQVLKDIIAQGSTCTKELQRLTSNDLIRIAGLEPRKRVLVESTGHHGIDEDTRDFMELVMHEAGLAARVIDADPDDQVPAQANPVDDTQLSFLSNTP
ncbi:MAG TPA: hypothetical protein VJ521_02680 [Acidobacteriota bacterium]|nr:hypothetical protein [Acidobacteriota bacterium]